MVHYLDFEKPIEELQLKIGELKNLALRANPFSDDSFGLEIETLEKKARELRTEIYSDLSEWQKVLISRHPDRPYTLDYIEKIFSDFVELSGDRSFSDDKALVCGLASLEGETVLVVGHQKGRTTPEKLVRNFAMPKPEGYRKALRLFELAERLNKPIITLLDTQGAYPGIDAEERGQSEAIAKNLMVMSGLKVPIISVVIGEGGSGGALGIGVCNRLLMLEYATYSVISPEGCAAILLRDGTLGSKMVESLKITAPHLFRFGIVDEIVPEVEGGAHNAPDEVASNLKKALLRHLKELQKLSSSELVEDRYNKLRKIGVFKNSQ